jgi:hypothetical protein
MSEEAGDFRRSDHSGIRDGGRRSSFLITTVHTIYKSGRCWPDVPSKGDTWAAGHELYGICQLWEVRGRKMYTGICFSSVHPDLSISHCQYRWMYLEAYRGPLDGPCARPILLTVQPCGTSPHGAFHSIDVYLSHVASAGRVPAMSGRASRAGGPGCAVSRAYRVALCVCCSNMF